MQISEKNNNQENVINKENIKLRQRPSISIRAKLTISYSLFFILCVSITVWSYWITLTLEKKIEFLEITDNYLAEIQQTRIFEKNFLLYGTNFDDALKSLNRAKKILNKNKAMIKKIIGEKQFQTKAKYMLNYQNQLLKFKNANDVRKKALIVIDLRKYAGQMVTFAEEVVKKERISVSKIILVAKRFPFYFISALLLLMMFFVILFTRQLMITLNRFMDYTKRIGDGDFSPIMPVRKYKDEFTKLAEAFNRMIRELDHRHNILLESHKLRAIGTLVAGVAHELNNPLNNTMLTAEMLKEDFSDLPENEKIEMVDEIISETERSDKIVKRLLDFARESETNFKSLEIKKIIKDSIRLVTNQIKLAKIKLEIDFDKNLPNVHGDEQLLKQVFINLILNAIDVLQKRGTIHIGIHHKNKTPGFLVIEVKDNGPGISEHIQNRIFEPFFTTKSQGKGTGLGLSVSLGIIKKLGGYIHCKSSADQGTTFTVSLPITDSPSEIMSK